MSEPIIAILGSVDKNRERELELLDVDTANLAAEQLGAALAEKKCRLLVSCAGIQGAEFAEAAVVRGYVGSGHAEPNSIEVHRPASGDLLLFPEESTHRDVFQYEISEADDWMVASFLSLANVDGMIILGGGQSTYISGLVGIGYRTPIVALPAFGGKAKEIWSLLKTGENRLSTQAEVSLMARPGWADDSAQRCVDILLAQRRRKEAGVAPGWFGEARRVSVLAAVVLVVFLGLLWVVAQFSRGPTLDAVLSLVLLWLPAFAGVAGATARLLFEWAQNKKKLASQAPTLVAATLGAIAGGISGLFFVLAQKIAIDDFGNDQATDLLPFVLVVGLVGGLTVDKIFPKLLSLDVLRTEALEGKPGG